MSENYKLYRQKMAERRNRSLGPQLMELFDLVWACELRWAIQAQS
jgi:hypothetical protein